MLRASSVVVVWCAVIAFGAPSWGQLPDIDWQTAERHSLRHHAQLTFSDQFVKAGEAYFCPETRWIIFQAVPVPPEGEAPDTFYSMYVAKLLQDENGRICGVAEPILVSPPGSANTCGFFHPTERGRIIFGSTLVPPEEGPAAGYQRGSNAYQWQFPEQMQVVTRLVPEILEGRPDGVLRFPGDEWERATPLWTRRGYDAECAYSPDGRFIVHTRVDPETQDPDLFIFDTVSNTAHAVVEAPGYDGGPFFSPDGRRICYRSDRRGNNLLQLYVMDFVNSVDERGVQTVETIEHQLTDNEHVNWAPYWHPSGEFLVYTTSEVSHANYEVFSIEAPRFGTLEPDRPLRARRITHATGFDGMPVFSPDGRHMMWTSQRGGHDADEERPSSQVWIAEVIDVSP